MAFYQPKKPGEETPDAFNGFNANAGAGQIDSPTQSKSSFGSLMSYLGAQPDRFDRSTTGIDRGEAAGRAAAPIKETAKYETSLQMADGSAPTPQRTSAPVEQTAAEKASAVRDQALGGAGNFKSHDASGRTISPMGAPQLLGTQQDAGSQNRQSDGNVLMSNYMTGPSLANASEQQQKNQAEYGKYRTQVRDLMGLTPEQYLIQSYNNWYNYAFGGAPRQADPIGQLVLNKVSGAMSRRQNTPNNTIRMNAPTVDGTPYGAWLESKYPYITELAMKTIFSDRNLKTDIDETTSDDITQILNELSGVK